MSEENQVPAAQYEWKTFRGEPVKRAEAARLTLPNRGTGEPYYTDTADHIFLENGEEWFVCTETGCEFAGKSVQAVIVGHRGLEHKDAVRRQATTAKKKLDISKFADMTLGQIVEALERKSDSHERLMNRLNSQIDMTTEARREAREAQRELREYKQAAAKFLGKLGE